jgi:hypothetical protein
VRVVLRTKVHCIIFTDSADRSSPIKIGWVPFSASNINYLFNGASNHRKTSAESKTSSMPLFWWRLNIHLCAPPLPPSSSHVPDLSGTHTAQHRRPDP